MIKLIFAMLMIVLFIIFCFVSLPEGLRPILLAMAFVLCILLLLLRFLPKDPDYKDPDYYKNMILAFGIGATIVSWFIVGYINNENEKKRNLLEFERSTSQSKRDLKVKFLIDAYFRLENSDHRDIAPKGSEGGMYDQIYIKYAESALTSVQLLGSDSTVRLANLYITSGGDFRKLLESLRDELRKELNLQTLPKTDDYRPSMYRTYRRLDAPNKLTPDQQFQLTLKLSEFDRGLLK